MKRYIACLRGKLFAQWCALRGHRIRIGPGLQLYCKLDIRGPGLVEIGSNCQVHSIWGGSKPYVTIYTHSPESHIFIGDNAMLVAVRISSRFSIRIGNDILIEEAGISDTDFHSIDRDRSMPLDETTSKCAIQIGNRVAIGAKSFVCKGVNIGDDTVVAPGSIVTRSLPTGIFALGNPARSLAK